MNVTFVVISLISLLTLVLEVDYYAEMSGLKCTAERYLTPATVAEIQSIVASSPSVRVVGARHSTSEIICANPNGTVIDMSSFASISVDASTRTATVGAGALLVNVQAALFDHGLSLIQTTSFGGITIGGAIGTGAHGSSLIHTGTIGDLVVGLKVVRADGSIATVAGDELRFYRPHLGLLGVIYEVTLQAVPLFKVKTVITEHDQDSGLSDMVSRAAKIDFYQLIWYPHHKKVIVHTAQYLPLSAPGSGGVLNWISNASLFGRTLYKVLYSLGPLGYCVLENEAEKAQLGYSLFRPPMLLDNGSSATSAIGYPHQMLMSTCTKGKCLWPSVKITMIGVAVPISSAAQAIDIVRDIYDHHPECLPLQGILFRFVKGTTSTLATAAAAIERGQDMLHIEIGVAPGSGGISRPFYTEFQRRLVEEAGARLHWGKNEAFKRASFDVSDFTAYMKSVDPNGLFQNDWSRAVFG